MGDKKITHCNQCPNHCPIDAVQCGRGKQLARQLKYENNHDDTVETNEDNDNLDEKDFEQKKTMDEFETEDFFAGGFHRSWWEHGNRKRENFWERHGRSGHMGRERTNFPGGALNEDDELMNLIRACGHYTFHNAGRRSGQGWIMHILSHIEEISQKELQNFMHIQPGSISELLAKMERAGYVKREKDEKDKRRTIVKITDIGKQHITDYYDAEEQDLFVALNTEQKEQLKELLQILLNSWYRG